MEAQAPGPAVLGTLLEQFYNGFIAAPDDLMGIGECINMIEAVENGPVPLPQGYGDILGQLKQVFTRIAIGDSSELHQNWEIIDKLMEQLRSGWSEVSYLHAEKVPDFPAPPATDDFLCSPAEEDPFDGDDPKGMDCSAVEDPELIKDFIEEAREHLSSIELNMLALERNPRDTNAIGEVFRPFHNIKGVSGFLNLTEIHQLTHEVETLLDHARSGKLLITDTVIDLVLTAVDILKSLIADLERGGEEGRATSTSTTMVKNFLDRLLSVQQDTDPPNIPSRKVGEMMVEGGLLEPFVVEDIVQQTKVTGHKFGEELIKQGLAEPKDVSKVLREQRHIRENAAFVRIDTGKLDNLVDMVGELVIAQSMVLCNPGVLGIQDQKLQKDCVQLRRITSELQRISMSMRMVPMKGTFQKFIRLVRDLSKKSGKEVVLEMKGEETEIDRNMVEEIYEPLVHMIRNAVDHGIETPEERVRAGKEPEGRILLSAEHKGGSIVIEIHDDGRGLDTEAIRRKAIALGLLSPGDNPDAEALYEFIFHPGFSTKESVSEVSGRGVGMDVVKRSVELLRGSMEIASTLGKGTCFKFKFPLTMAIIDGMVIRIGSERYIIPTIAVNESLRPAVECYRTVHGKGELIRVRDCWMPLIRLHRILQEGSQATDPWEAIVLVVKENGSSYCLLVDEIIGRQEVVIKSLGSTMNNIAGISGGAILGDGRVALIIDVKGIVDLHEGSRRS